MLNQPCRNQPSFNIAAVGYYKDAVIYIQEDEYIRGQRFIPKDFQVKTFKDSVFVDDEIVVKKIGGHTLINEINEKGLSGK